MCELTVCAQNLENYIESRNGMMVFPPIYFIDKHMIIPNLTENINCDTFSRCELGN